jgi:predicted nucleotidyltransferase
VTHPVALAPLPSRLFVPPLIRNALIRFREELAVLFGRRLQSVRLYGSWARGAPHVGSDVDVLVLIEGCSSEDARRVTSVEADVLLETGVPLSIQIVSTERFDFLLGREVGFAQNVAREGIPL